MLQSNNGQRKVFSSGPLDSLHRIRKASYPIRQEDGEPIRGYDNNTDIDPASRQFVSQVSHIYNQEIAAAGKLDLDSQADPGAVDGLTFCPIHSARCLITPAFKLSESGIQNRPDLGCAICISPFLKEQIESSNDLFQL